MTAKARVLDWLERADFNNHGCRHSQETIALAVNCSRRTVIRALFNLEREGLITVQRPRQRGVCNTYRVRDWNPHRRSDVLAVLARVRKTRRAQCHTKRTADLSRAQTTSQNHSKPSSWWHDQRCGREPVNQGEQETRMLNPVAVIRDRLEAKGCNPRGPQHTFMAGCPVHDDSSASLSVKEGDDGRALLNCFAGCETPTIVAELGLQLRDLFTPTAPGTRPRKRKPRPNPDRQPTRKQIDQALSETGYPIDRVLARYAPNYRAASSPGFWITECRVCSGELWIQATLDDEAKPSGPVTLSCANGCVKNAGGGKHGR